MRRGPPSDDQEANTIADSRIETGANQNEKILPDYKASANEVDDKVVVGMPQKETSPRGHGIPSPRDPRNRSVLGTVSPPKQIATWYITSADSDNPSWRILPDIKEEEEDVVVAVEVEEENESSCMALEPFALEYYNLEAHRRGKDRNNTKMKSLLSWQGNQISSPLTIACGKKKVLSSQSIASFGAIMGYMGDKNMKESGINLLKNLQKRMLEGSAELTDEIFCQLCKQTKGNPDAYNDIRGWQLILALLAVATPSAELSPFFEKHCTVGPVGLIPQTYAQYALKALRKEEYLKARCIAPCDVEITALIQLSAVPVSVHLLDGREIEVAANSWTSAANLEKQMAQELGIKKASPFGLFEVSHTDGDRALGSNDRILDVIAKWRTQASSSLGTSKFALFYKVRLQLPADELDVAAVEMNYLQATQDLQDGMFDVTLKECVKLAAYQLQEMLGDYDKKLVTLSSLEEDLEHLLPEEILMSPDSDDLAAKVMAFYMINLNGLSKKECRAQFMALINENSSFGYTTFSGIAFDKTAVIAISSSGIKFFDNTEEEEDGSVLAECSFEDVESFVCPSDGVALITLTESDRPTYVRSVSIQSPSAQQMKSLVHAYFVRYVLPNKAKHKVEGDKISH